MLHQAARRWRLMFIRGRPVTASPCWWCFQMIANAGLVTIVYLELSRHQRHLAIPQRHGTEHVTVHAPTAPGTFLVIWDMVQGDTTWFSAQGAPAGTQVLQVVKPGALARATPMPGEKTVVQPDVSLRYLKDTSFPDGTTVAPRAHFDKGWLVFNDGKRTWSPDWLLQLRSGPSLGAKQISLPTAAGCTSANIIVHLHAPSRPRHVVSVWQLRDPAGTYVGERLSLRIDVRVSSPQPTVSATPHARPTTTAAVPISDTTTRCPR